jgi:hypothetical protein
MSTIEQRPKSKPLEEMFLVPRLASRVAPISTKSMTSSLEVAVLIVAGCVAATAVAFLQLGLRVPGHKILLAAFPMLVGLMLVPRRFSGTMMGLAAAATIGCFSLAGVGRLQPAAVVPLLALGPILDLALAGTTRSGWQLYALCAAAGMAANLGAFMVRWGLASWGLDAADFHVLKEFGWSTAGSFAACGLVAGLLSGAACFRWSSGHDVGASQEVS